MLQLAGLPPEYGLYCSFIGTTVYPVRSIPARTRLNSHTCQFLGTSKDITLGPIAVVSLTVAEVISNIHQKYPGVWSSPQISSMLGFLCVGTVGFHLLPFAKRTCVSQGVVVFLLGALRLGWLVEFIPAPAVGGFVTGTAIQIASSQLPRLLGIKREGDSAFEVIWNTLRNIRQARLDSALGISGLVSLYLFRRICEVLTKKYPRHGLQFPPLLCLLSLTWFFPAQTFFFISVIRNVFVAVALTFVSWVIVTNSNGKPPIAILGEVPRGFRIGAIPFDKKLVGVAFRQLPVPCVVLLLCHIAIGKCKWSNLLSGMSPHCTSL